MALALSSRRRRAARAVDALAARRGRWHGAAARYSSLTMATTTPAMTPVCTHNAVEIAADFGAHSGKAGIEVGLRGQTGLTVARGGGVGFGLLILDTRGHETLRPGERVEARFRVDGSHAATIGRGARGDKRRGGRPAILIMAMGAPRDDRNRPAAAPWAKMRIAGGRRALHSIENGHRGQFGRRRRRYRRRCGRRSHPPSRARGAGRWRAKPKARGAGARSQRRAARGRGRRVGARLRGRRVASADGQN